MLRIIESQDRIINNLLEGLIEIKAEWSDPLTQLANEAMKKKQ
jgi:hypothetical protein